MIPSQLDPVEKIQLFMSLFRGREDVYAKRWQNREGRAGYAPVCRNEWKAGLWDQGNSVFVDENFRPYEDQWGFMASIRRLSEEEIAGLLAEKRWPRITSDCTETPPLFRRFPYG